MKKLKLAFGSTIQPNIFEGEDGGDGGDTGAGGAGGGGAADVFTQDQVNSMIATERKKLESQGMKKNQELLKQLEMLQTTAKLSKDERSSLETEMEELRNKAYTAEELAAQEREKLSNQYKERENILSEERDAWRTRYTEAQVTRSITDAAVEHDAFNNEQVVALLKPDTRLVEVKDEDGKLVGYEPKVFKKTHKDGAQVTLELTPKQAVEQMKENKAFFNLFKGKSVDGVGSVNSGGSDIGSLENVKSLADYKKKRDKILGK